MRTNSEPGKLTSENFERLWMRAEPSVLRVVSKRLRGWSRDDQEDLVQRSRVRAWTMGQLLDLDQINSFTAWVCQVTVWTCLEATRERRRASRLKILEPVEYEDGSNLLDLIASDNPSALESLLDQERLAVLRAAVIDMPRESARAVALAIQDLSPSEIAAKTGVSVSTVRGRLHRGRLWARRNLDLHGSIFEGDTSLAA